MQAASVQEHQRAVSGFHPGSVSPFAWVVFHLWLLHVTPHSQNPARMPPELLALLLLEAPLVFTITKLLLLL